MRFRLGSLATGMVVACLGSALLAHHSLEDTYDVNRTVTLVGAVSRVEWVNPHARLHVDVRNADGGITTWSVELGAPNTMVEYGVGPSVLTVGDQVSVDVWIAKDSSLTASGRVLRLANGSAPYVAAPWAARSSR
jgi:Family of unknown function (DUF6152)